MDGLELSEQSVEAAALSLVAGAHAVAFVELDAAFVEHAGSGLQDAIGAGLRLPLLDVGCISKLGIVFVAGTFLRVGTIILTVAAVVPPPKIHITGNMLVEGVALVDILPTEFGVLIEIGGVVVEVIVPV